MLTVHIRFQRKWPVSLMHLLDMTQAQIQSLDKPVQRRHSTINLNLIVHLRQLWEYVVVLDVLEHPQTQHSEHTFHPIRTVFSTIMH